MSHVCMIEALNDVICIGRAAYYSIQWNKRALCDDNDSKHKTSNHFMVGQIFKRVLILRFFNYADSKKIINTLFVLSSSYLVNISPNIT